MDRERRNVLTQTVETGALPAEQMRIIRKCYHPSAVFEPFERGAIDRSIADRFETIAAKHPGRPAVCCDDRTLRYAELNDLADRIAHSIPECGGGEHAPVMIVMKKDARLVAAILGVLKTGRFYLPVDPALPAARRERVLADSGARLLLTAGESRRVVGDLARPGLKVLDVDRLPPAASSRSPRPPIRGHDLAYVTYTSGSTGLPKGVMQTHRNLMQQVMTITNALHLCMHDRVALPYSLGFTASIWNLFAALLNGAAAVLFDTDRQGVHRLGRWMMRERITFCDFVATVFRVFTGTLTGGEEFPHLRAIRLGSEAVHADDISRMRTHLPSTCVFYNGIGCAEAFHYRWFFGDRDSPIEGQTVPVGYAMDGKEVFLLDDAGRRVGFDRPGEIVVRSRFLSPGYWRDPELTKKRFLPDPGGGEQRIYRTGDIGILRPDGCLHHVGRKDFQVQVRGYRVELEDVEAALNALPEVRHAVAVPIGDGSGGHALVGCYVLTGPRALTAAAVKTSLSEQLPSYMVPSRLVELDSLPRNASGKADRVALAERLGSDLPSIQDGR
jgi:amino acid adenylation domain-containing protein